MQDATRTAARPPMVRAYLEMIEEVTAVADAHRRMMAARLGARASGQLRLLSLLAETPMNGRPPHLLAARMGMPKTTLSRLLAEMRAAGLIETGDAPGAGPEDGPEDGRACPVWITDIGHLAREEMIAALAPDLVRLAAVSQLRCFTDAKIAAGHVRRLQAMSLAKPRRAARRRRARG